MTRVTLRSGRSTWTTSIRPTTPIGQSSTGRVKSGARHTWLDIPAGSGLQKGAAIASDVIRIPVPVALSGLRSVTVQRAAASWPLSVTWDTQPGVTGVAKTVTVGAVAAGTVVEFEMKDDTQAWLDAGGVDHPGWQVSTNDATGFDVTGIPGAERVLEYTYTPVRPSNLLAGNVGKAKPRLTFDAVEHDAIRVQIAPSGVAYDQETGFASPTFTSSTVLTSADSYDLADSSYGGLSSGSTRWIVQVRVSGKWSPWAAPATITRVPWPALTVVSPVGTVYDSQPQMDADMTGMTAVQWLVPSAGYDSGKIATTTGVHTPRSRVLKPGVPTTVTVRAWDGVDRVDGAFTTASATATFNLSAVLAGPDTVTATQDGISPPVKVFWTDAAPGSDSYVVTRSDGAELGPFAAASVAVPGGYQIEDWTVAPARPVTYTVQPFEDGVRGAGESVTITPHVPGQWLVDELTLESALILGDDVGTYAEPETAVVHALESAQYVVRRRSGRRKPEGAVAGVLVDSVLGERALDDLALLEKWADPEQTPADHPFRLVLGHKNMPVHIGDLLPSPSPLTDSGQLVVGVSLSYWSRPETGTEPT